MMTRNRWQTLMQQLKFAENIPTFERLQQSYSEPHRHYHTTQHINALLAHFDASQTLANEPLAVELALWFHDAVYKPRSTRNEQDSADWASQFLQQNNASAAFITTVYDLIMATEHNSECNSHDARLVVDIDLSILGSTPAVYAEFERNVRKEYSFVPRFIFRRKRKAILKEFLARNAIYTHSYFYELFENKARTNLTQAIANL